jgi:threonine/homoserine/homoserine lactone efflux protein
MPLDMLLKGAALGFSIAAPVGPIGVLCIRRTLAGGRLVGFASGLGAAVADTMYGCVAAFGLTWVSGFLVSQKTWLQLIGGLFLLYMGVTTFRARPADRAASGGAGEGPLKAFLSTFALTVTNPMTILSFAAVFAGLGLARAGSGPADAGLMVAGIFTGSAAWWALLAFGTGAIGPRVDATMMRRVNQVSGVIIMAFAAIALGTIR